MDKELYQETRTVNASACEFMELILRSINQYKELVQEITHLIIKPVVKTLRCAIDNSNNAQQVHLLNLLRVILFECNFHNQNLTKKGDAASIAFVQNAKDIIEKPLFLQCIVDGMKNEVNFVRYHYIQFAQKIVPYMKQIATPHQ
jgi:hypothetical protein